MAGRCDARPESLDNAVDPTEVTAGPDGTVPLAVQRRGAVLAVVRGSGARHVGDFGCGEGALVSALLADPAFVVSDHENSQAATADAFDVSSNIAGKVSSCIAGKRLAGGRLTVIDATSVQPDARKQLVALAREHDVLPVAIVLDIPERVCVERNVSRPETLARRLCADWLISFGVDYGGLRRRVFVPYMC